MNKNGDPDREALTKELFREAERRNEELTAFLAMIQRLAEVASKHAEQKPACETFVRILIEETDFENCSIFFQDREGSGLSLVAAFGLDDQLQASPSAGYGKDRHFLPEGSIAGRVLRLQKPAFIEDANKTPIPAVKEALVTPVSLICLPIGTIGVLNLSSNHPRSISPESRRNWETLGKIIESFIHRLIRSKEGGESSRSAPAPSEKEPCSPEEEVQHPQTDTGICDLALARMPQGVCILDSQGNIRRVNQAVERITGDNIVKIFGRSPAVLFRDPSTFERLLSRVDESDTGKVEKIDFEIMNSTGELRYADITLIRLPNGSGYLLILDDVTGKKSSFERILRSEKLAALSTLATGVSHDFNNLLMSILGNIQLILPQIETREIAQRLECLEKAVLDGSNTVRRLQRLTEREAAPYEMEPSSDVEETVKDVVELTRPRWKNLMERSGIKIDMQLELAADCFAAIHASDLREVLTNLLLNAIEAMPEGGTIAFRSHRRGGHIFLEVSDTGLGMSKETAKKIFDPFFTTKGAGNSGLGLSVSWGLLVRNGAEIQVKSRQGRGTTFVLKLQAASEVKDAPSAGLKGEKGSYSLLVVEDDTEILSLMRDMLRLKGHKVKAVSDSRMALRLIATDDFDMVLTDLGMPGVSGWEIARQTKAKNSKTPVLMITGWGIQYKDEELNERGVDLVLPKPLGWDKLLGVIDRML